jgi:xylulokinase
MARAIMESAGYELRWALDTIREAGQPVKHLWMVGGAAQSLIWPAILSETTAIPICIPGYDNWPALGAAILAGVGSGVYDSIDQALVYFTKPTRPVDSDNGNENIYQAGFIQYQELIQRNH